MGKVKKEPVEQEDQAEITDVSIKTEPQGYDEKVDHCAVIAKPMAPKKLSKKIYKLIKKSSSHKNYIRNGLKIVQKQLRLGEKGTGSKSEEATTDCMSELRSKDKFEEEVESEKIETEPIVKSKDNVVEQVKNEAMETELIVQSKDNVAEQVEYEVMDTEPIVQSSDNIEVAVEYEVMDTELIEQELVFAENNELYVQTDFDLSTRSTSPAAPPYSPLTPPERGRADTVGNGDRDRDRDRSRSPLPTSSATTFLNFKPLVFFAGDISPIEIMCHLPAVCEEKDVPYCYTPSRKDIGSAMGTMRGCIMVLVKEHDDYKDLYDEVRSEMKLLGHPV